jgi:hypothetical protein
VCAVPDDDKEYHVSLVPDREGAKVGGHPAGDRTDPVAPGALLVEGGLANRSPSRCRDTGSSSAASPGREPGRVHRLGFVAARRDGRASATMAHPRRAATDADLDPHLLSSLQTRRNLRSSKARQSGTGVRINESIARFYLDSLNATGCLV